MIRLNQGSFTTFVNGHVPVFVIGLSGPFKINGVPLRRVNQSYVIGTSTKVDISGVSLDKFDDKYFGKVAEKKNKKGEGEFFQAEKEVYQVHSRLTLSDPFEY